MYGSRGIDGGETFCGGVLWPPLYFPILATLSNFGGSKVLYLISLNEVFCREYWMLSTLSASDLFGFGYSNIGLENFMLSPESNEMLLRGLKDDLSDREFRSPSSWTYPSLILPVSKRGTVLQKKRNYKNEYT